MKKKPNKLIIGVIAAVVVVVLALVISGGSGNSGGSGGFGNNKGNKGQENTEVTIAQPITLSDYSVREGENSIQDPVAYFGSGLFEYDGGGSHMKMTGRGDEAIEAFDDYVNYVKTNFTDFVVKTEKKDDYRSSGQNYYDSCYRFALTDSEGIKTLSEEYNEVVYLHLFWQYGKGEFIIHISQDFTFRDLGYRHNAPKVAVTPSGESAGAGVIRKGNTFSTTDGRLSCELGNATILKSGSSLTSSVKYKNISGKNDTFLADGFNGDEAIGIKIPIEEVEKCDIYIKYDVDGTSSSRKYFLTILPAETTEIYYSRNGENFWEYPNPNNPAVKDVTLRFMYYDGEVAVYYVYIDVDEPVELFGAVSLKQEEPETQENNSGSSGSSGSNSNSSWNDRNNNSVDFCSRCGNKGWYDCNDCVDGYNRVKITVPSPTKGAGGTFFEKIPCKSRGCNAGKIDCDRCDN